ncbi:MAG: peptidyl-prolyl cis-trans isomerase [Fimbriimonadaceae bacterium]|nr:peptidyl-prolyl cis-trans isomerase [Fimbriimonadaceae bacterium]
MDHMRSPSRLVLVALAALCSLAARAQFGEPSKPMVVVNGEAISTGTFWKRMPGLPRVGELVGGKFVVSTPGFLTLNRVMNELLLLQLAKEKQVYPADTEITAAVEETKKLNPEIVAGLGKLGMTEADLRYDVTVQIAEFKLQTMGVNVTDQQIEAYYRGNISKYTIPDLYHLRIIAVDTEEKRKAAEADLSSGTSFDQVARKHSVHLSKTSGGDMGEVPFEGLSESFQKLVEGKSAGFVSDWMRGDAVFVKIKLDEVKKGKVLPLDTNLKAEVRKALMLERGSDRNDLGKLMADMRKRARIEYQGTAFDEQLKAAFGG